MITSLALLLVAPALSLGQGAPPAPAGTPGDARARTDGPAPIEWRTFQVSADLAIRYALVLPEGFDPAQQAVASTRLPMVFALPPGSQNEALVEQGLALYWSEAARANRWIVASPAAPTGQLFHGAADGAALALAEALTAEFLPEGGRLHLAGVSNGGRSAFHLALDSPERWHSLTVLPGVAPEGADLSGLAQLPIALFGGGADEAWANGMRAAQEQLLAHGAPAVHLELFEGEGHVPASLQGGERLFERLAIQRESAMRRRAAELAVRTTLDDFHDAAAQADGERYFAHFAPGAVYFGTDASERWTVAEFRSYAQPYFERGQGWTYVPTRRAVALSLDGNVAWFDEALLNAKYGETRGTGVLVHNGRRWRIAQYNLVLPVPNELAGELIEKTRQLKK